jgi:hypothetical protein
MMGWAVLDRNSIRQSRMPLSYSSAPVLSWGMTLPLILPPLSMQLARDGCVAVAVQVRGWGLVGARRARLPNLPWRVTGAWAVHHGGEAGANAPKRPFTL